MSHSTTSPRAAPHGVAACAAAPAGSRAAFYARVYAQLIQLLSQMAVR
jgi:hypothetical protein